MKSTIILVGTAILTSAMASSAFAQVQSGQGQIVLCPKTVNVGVTSAPPGWGNFGNGGGFPSPFVSARVTAGILNCDYSPEAPKLGPLGLLTITRPGIGGMLCSVDKGNPMQFNCMPSNIGAMAGQRR